MKCVFVWDLYVYGVYSVCFKSIGKANWQLYTPPSQGSTESNKNRIIRYIFLQLLLVDYFWMGNIFITDM